MTSSLLLPWGLPLLAAVGALVAVAVVWATARALQKSAWDTVVEMLGLVRSLGQWLLGPLRSLGRSLLPLALPLVVILLFGTRALSPALQFVAGVVLAGLVWLFVRGEGEVEHERAQVQELIGRTRGVTRGTALPSLARMALPWGLILGLGLFMFLVVGGFAGQFSTWESVAGPSGWAEFFALLFLSCAVPFRLYGYATNPYRGAAVAALALLGLQVLVVGGVLDDHSVLNDLHLDFGAASIGFGVLFIAALVIEAVVVAYPPPMPGPFHRSSRASGFVLAALAASGLFVALFIASCQATGGAARIGSIKAALDPKIVHTFGGADEQLAWTFAPVLQIEHNERYGPTGVRSFLAQATESGARKPKVAGDKLDLGTLPRICPDGSHDACGTLTCSACADDVTPEQSGYVAQGVLYARVVHRAKEPKVFAGWTSTDHPLTTLIQYWIFYLYDRWQTETVVGSLTQEHQGDWEFVTVGLGPGDRPLFLALSAHCGGQVVQWTQDLPAAYGHLADGRIVMSDHRFGQDDEVSHPIIAVARGSHANYSDSGGHRPPDWGSCKHLPSSALTAVSYASNVRDLTASGHGGWFAYPRSVSVVESVHGLPGRPFSYPGSWGAHEMVTFSHHKPFDTGAGPKSPPLQGKSWKTPVKLFFCDPYWHGPHLWAEKCAS